MVRLAPALLAIASLTACIPRLGGPSEPRSRDVAVGTVRFRIVYLPGDSGAVDRIVHAVEAAAPRVQRWGNLDQPITITIHPTHAALEAAVNRPGYEWLRAWARYQTVDIQSPRTWGLLGVSDRKLTELVTHELTHCAMYQEAGDDLTWMYKEIPRWFSEGIASVTAGQGYRYGSLDDLWKYYADKLPGSGDGVPGRRSPARNPVAIAGDPIVDPDPLYQEQSDVVYGAAHHAAQFLIGRYGETKIHRVLQLMGGGMRFPAAFREAIGISDAEFASDFRRYVVWQGWRRSR